MLRRLGAILIVLAFATPTLAGGFVCGQGDHSSAGEMACCRLAKSLAASPTAVVCCEVVCGESTGGSLGTQSEKAASLQVPAPPVAPLRVDSFDSLLAVVIPVSLKASSTALLRRDPPALFLHNTAFLI